MFKYIFRQFFNWLHSGSYIRSESDHATIEWHAATGRYVVTDRRGNECGAYRRESVALLAVQRLNCDKSRSVGRPTPNTNFVSGRGRHHSVMGAA